MSLTLREQSQDALEVGAKKYHYYSLPKAAQQVGDIDRVYPSPSKFCWKTCCAGRMEIPSRQKIFRRWRGGSKLPMPTEKLPIARRAS